MRKYVKWIIGFGILIWLIPFLISFVVFPLKDSNRPLFESIMPISTSFKGVSSALIIISCPMEQRDNNRRNSITDVLIIIFNPE